MMPGQALCNECEQLLELLGLERQRRSWHVDTSLSGPGPRHPSGECSMEAPVLIETSSHHLLEVGWGIGMPAGKRQHRCQIVLEAGLRLVTRLARRHFRQVATARFQEESARENMVLRGRRTRRAVNAHSVFELLEERHEDSRVDDVTTT